MRDGITSPSLTRFGLCCVVGLRIVKDLDDREQRMCLWLVFECYAFVVFAAFMWSESVRNMHGDTTGNSNQYSKQSTQPIHVVEYTLSTWNLWRPS